MLYIIDYTLKSCKQYVKLIIFFFDLHHRPHTIVESKGVSVLCQHLISVSAMYGKVPTESVIPTVSTVSHHLNDVVDMKRSKLKKELILVTKIWGVIRDGWTHKNTNIKYLTLTIQFVDKNLILPSKMLATRPVEDNTANKTKLHKSKVLND